MTIGTKSVLFGVHCFWWHPITVFLAFRRLWARWPTLPEIIGIVVHDLGYFGCHDIDGLDGKQHPKKGSELAYRLVYCIYAPFFVLRYRSFWFGRAAAGAVAHDARQFVKYHSRHMASIDRMYVSNLCWPDKFSILQEPKWWYLFRAKLSGELREYELRAAMTTRWKPFGNTDWYDWYLSNLRYEWSMAKFGNKPGANYATTFVSEPTKRLDQFYAF